MELNRRLSAGLWMACGLAILAGRPAWAQTQPLSDELRITNGAGKVVKDIKILESATPPESTGVHRVTVSGVTSLFDPSQFGRFIALFDPGPVVRISDIVGIYQAKTPLGPMLEFAFASDTEIKSPLFNNWVAPGVAPPPIPETGPIDVTRFLNPALQANNWKATFASDAELPPPSAPQPAGVPEPASWVMLLAGAGVVGGALRAARSRVGSAACPS
jgi:hypothetical protein